MRRYVAGSFIMTVAMTLILTVGALLGIEGLLHILDTPCLLYTSTWLYEEKDSGIVWSVQ